VQVNPSDTDDDSVRVTSEGRRLEIKGAELRHSGLYRCQADNSAGQANRQFQLSVIG